MPLEMPGLGGGPEGGDDAGDSPLAALASRMTARPQQGVQLIAQAIATLRQAGEADKRLQPVTGAAIKLLLQGPSGMSGPNPGMGQPPVAMMGGPAPMPGTSIPVRSP